MGAWTLIVIYYIFLLDTPRTFSGINEGPSYFRNNTAFIKTLFPTPPVPVMHFLFGVTVFQANNSNFLL